MAQCHCLPAGLCLLSCHQPKELPPTPSPPSCHYADAASEPPELPIAMIATVCCFVHVEHHHRLASQAHCVAAPSLNPSPATAGVWSHLPPTHCRYHTTIAMPLHPRRLLPPHHRKLHDIIIFLEHLPIASLLVVLLPIPRSHSILSSFKLSPSPLSDASMLPYHVSSPSAAFLFPIAGLPSQSHRHDPSSIAAPPKLPHCCKPSTTIFIPCLSPPMSACLSTLPSRRHIHHHPSHPCHCPSSHGLKLSSSTGTPISIQVPPPLCCKPETPPNIAGPLPILFFPITHHPSLSLHHHHHAAASSPLAIPMPSPPLPLPMPSNHYLAQPIVILPIHGIQ